MSTEIKKGVRAKLTVQHEGRVIATYLLREGERALLGRGDSNDIVIDDAGISRQHTAFEVRAEGLHITDLDSLNGTFVGKHALHPGVPTLHLGEPVVIGRFTLGVQLTGARRGERPSGTSQSFQLPPVPREEFEILGLLGRGSAGTVWAARQRFLDRRVAIKVLQADLDPEERERFVREAQLYCRFKSPRILGLHDIRRVKDGSLCLILELVQGPTAGDWLATRKRLEIPEVLQIGADVAEALILLGQAGIVHRDIKPHNLLLSAEGRAKVGDFGIAKIVNSGLTGSNLGLGTLAYVAPEQAVEARSVGPAADIYGLGATLFELLTGRPPLRLRGKMMQRLNAIAETVPPRVSELRVDVPRALDDVIAAMLAKPPDDRPSAQLVKRLLEEVLATQFPDWEGGDFEESETRAIQRHPLDG